MKYIVPSVAFFAVMLAILHPSLAQEVMALAIEGWQQQTDGDGVVSYRCASEICAAGSVVSYKTQPHRSSLTLHDFESHHRSLAAHYKGTANMRDVRISGPRERSIDGVRVLQLNREVDWTSGNTTFTIEARLIGPDRSFSLASDSPGRDWTTNNFEGFLRPLADIAGVRKP